MQVLAVVDLLFWAIREIMQHKEEHLYKREMMARKEEHRSLHLIKQHNQEVLNNCKLVESLKQARVNQK